MPYTGTSQFYVWEIDEVLVRQRNKPVNGEVLKMAVNGTGTRATGRILGISKDTVTAVLKKQDIGRGR